MILIIGILYDTVGRKKVTVFTFILGAIATLMTPVVSPSIIGYDIVRIVFI